MTKEYVCIECQGVSRACHLTKCEGCPTPMICGPDSNGYAKIAFFREVPANARKEEVITKTYE